MIRLFTNELCASTCRVYTKSTKSPGIRKGAGKVRKIQQRSILLWTTCHLQCSQEKCLVSWVYFCRIFLKNEKFLIILTDPCVGHNGAGKTTTMKVITAEEAPTHGRVSFSFCAGLSRTYLKLSPFPSGASWWPRHCVESIWRLSSTGLLSAARRFVAKHNRSRAHGSLCKYPRHCSIAHSQVKYSNTLLRPENVCV